jgi:hypothetical protein
MLRLFILLVVSPLTLAALTPKEVKKHIEDELVYPISLYGQLPLPPKTKEQKAFLKRLKDQKFFLSSKKVSPKLGPKARDMQLLRGYPSYEVKGLRFRLCDLGVHIEKVEKQGGLTKAHGTLKVARSSLWLKRRGLLEKTHRYLRCEEKAMTWEIQNNEKGVVVDEKRRL